MELSSPKGGDANQTNVIAQQQQHCSWRWLLGHVHETRLHESWWSRPAPQKLTPAQTASHVQRALDTIAQESLLPDESSSDNDNITSPLMAGISDDVTLDMHTFELTLVPRIWPSLCEMMLIQGYQSTTLSTHEEAASYRQQYTSSLPWMPPMDWHGRAQTQWWLDQFERNVIVPFEREAERYKVQWETLNADNEGDQRVLLARAWMERSQQVKRQHAHFYNLLLSLSTKILVLGFFEPLASDHPWMQSPSNESADPIALRPPTIVVLFTAGMVPMTTTTTTTNANVKSSPDLSSSSFYISSTSHGDSQIASDVGKTTVSELDELLQLLNIRRCIAISRQSFTVMVSKSVGQDFFLDTQHPLWHTDDFLFDWYRNVYNAPMIKIPATTMTSEEPSIVSTTEEETDAPRDRWHVTLQGLSDSVAALTKIESNGTLAKRLNLNVGDIMETHRFFPKPARVLRLVQRPETILVKKRPPSQSATTIAVNMSKEGDLTL